MKKVFAKGQHGFELSGTYEPVRGFAVYRTKRGWTLGVLDDDPAKLAHLELCGFCSPYPERYAAFKTQRQATFHLFNSIAAGAWLSDAPDAA